MEKGLVGMFFGGVLATLLLLVVLQSKFPSPTSLPPTPTWTPTDIPNCVGNDRWWAPTYIPKCVGYDRWWEATCTPTPTLVVPFQWNPRAGHFQIVPPTPLPTYPPIIDWNVRAFDD